MVVAAQVQHAVDDRRAQVLGVLGADHDVAQLARSSGPCGLIDRKGEHVGGAVAAPVLAVERADPPGVDELDREMAVRDACGRKRGERGAAQLGGCLELDQPCCWRRGARSAGACFSAYSLYAATIRWTSL